MHFSSFQVCFVSTLHPFTCIHFVPSIAAATDMRWGFLSLQYCQNFICFMVFVFVMLLLFVFVISCYCWLFVFVICCLYFSFDVCICYLLFVFVLSTAADMRDEDSYRCNIFKMFFLPKYKWPKFDCQVDFFIKKPNQIAQRVALANTWSTETHQG